MSGLTAGSLFLSSRSSTTKSPHIERLITTAVNTSNAANQITARRLTSAASCATSGFSRLPCGCAAASVPGVLPMGEHLLEVRIVDRQQRVAPELRGEQVEPDAGQADRKGDVRQADREGAVIEIRRD